MMASFDFHWHFQEKFYTALALAMYLLATFFALFNLLGRASFIPLWLFTVVCVSPSILMILISNRFLLPRVPPLLAWPPTSPTFGPVSGGIRPRRSKRQMQHISSPAILSLDNDKKQLKDIFIHQMHSKLQHSMLVSPYQLSHSIITYFCLSFNF